MERTPVRKSLPQAVPRSMLSIMIKFSHTVIQFMILIQMIHTAIVVVDTSLGQHSIVLKFRLAKRGAVAGNDNKLGYKRKKQKL